MSDEEYYSPFGSKEEYNKFIESILKGDPNPSTIFGHQLVTSISFSPEKESDGIVLPFEQDEQGNYYGYKILKRIPNEFWFVSPNYPMLKGIWHDHQMTSDRLPNQIEPHQYAHGIHGTKTVEELDGWIDQYKQDREYRREYSALFAVKIVLFGDIIIETEKGFRAHKARILDVIKEV